jgi:hypothetical protein
MEMSGLNLAVCIHLIAAGEDFPYLMGFSEDDDAKTRCNTIVNQRSIAHGLRVSGGVVGDLLNGDLRSVDERSGTGGLGDDEGARLNLYVIYEAQTANPLGLSVQEWEDDA